MMVGKDESKTFGRWWKVDDMMKFHNIGFSRAIQGSGMRYLTCPDCEKDILGYNVVSNTKEYFLCADRVQEGGTSKPPISLSPAVVDMIKSGGGEPPSDAQ
jgi:hypothetical protein